MTRADLIAACEAATGPSRELDERITQALYPEIERREGADGAEWFLHGHRVRILDYTGSLDDALSLVPTGWEWLVSNRAPALHEGRAYINNGQRHFTGVGAGFPNPEYRECEVTAATAPLALVAACLRALPDTRREMGA